MEVEALIEVASLAAYMAMPAAAVMTTTTVLSVAFMWLRYPAAALFYLQHLGFYVLGMRIKYVDVNGLKVCYVEKGKRKQGTPSILILHGFTAGKDMWLTLLPGILKDQHVVLVDLPGHGATEIPDDHFDVSIPGLAHFVHAFAGEVGLNKQPFHLIGTSLSGAIAGLYGALYAEELAILTLICPAMITPVETEFTKELQAGRCHLLPDTVEGVQKMLQLCCYNNSLIPMNRQVMNAFLQLRQPNEKFFWRLFKEITTNMEEQFKELMTHVVDIKCPTQVIWGRQDEVIHVSGAEVLHNALPNCPQLDILEECGHLPAFDCPGELAKRLKQFRARYY